MSAQASADPMGAQGWGRTFRGVLGARMGGQAFMSLPPLPIKPSLEAAQVSLTGPAGRGQEQSRGTVTWEQLENGEDIREGT